MLPQHPSGRIEELEDRPRTCSTLTYAMLRPASGVLKTCIDEPGTTGVAFSCGMAHSGEVFRPMRGSRALCSKYCSGRVAHDAS
jgi:hypothetical protein